jgi:hypothetical protein
MKRIYFLLTVALFCLLFANSCFVSGRKDAGETSNSNAGPDAASDNSKTDGAKSSAPAANEIRKVDFKNFTYEPTCAGEKSKKVTVKKGEFTIPSGDDQMYFTVTEVAYGDLNGDQTEEAIITTLCNTGGTGQFSEGFIYSLKDGKPEFLTRFEGGDRAYGGLRSAKAENGLLVVKRNDVSDSGGACCPEFVVTTKYKLEGKELKQTGGADRRDLYPPQRVKFEKGAVETTLSVKLTNDDDIKRFIIGGAPYQMLTVQSASKDVSITLIKGDAEVLDDGSDLLEANLKENGDYIVQVQKLGDKNVNASVTFTIQ